MLIAQEIRKYGRENFKVEVLYDNVQTKEELNALEIKAMKEHNTLIPNGYNIRVGGQGSESTKKEVESKGQGKKIWR